MAVDDDSNMGEWLLRPDAPALSLDVLKRILVRHEGGVPQLDADMDAIAREIHDREQRGELASANTLHDVDAHPVPGHDPQSKDPAEWMAARGYRASNGSAMMGALAHAKRVAVHELEVGRKKERKPRAQVAANDARIAEALAQYGDKRGAAGQIGRKLNIDTGTVRRRLKKLRDVK